MKLLKLVNENIMKEEKLKIFINSVIGFFNRTNDTDVSIGSPYLTESIKEMSSDYTGVIAISGEYAGECYFSAPKVLLRHLILSMGETDTSESMMLDTVGEVANTLSGNARKKLGHDFIISTPRIIKGAIKRKPQESGDRFYVIPIKWKSYKASLGVRLQ